MARPSERHASEHTEGRGRGTGWPGASVFLLPLLLLLLFPALSGLGTGFSAGLGLTLHAQGGEFGTLRVEVRGDEGPGTPQLLAGVTLTLVPEGPGVPVERRTSSAGVVEFAFVPAGRWTLRAERFGYVPLVVEGVQVPRADRVTLPVVLRVATAPVDQVDRVPFRTLAPAAAAAAAAAGRELWGLRVDPVTAVLESPRAGEGGWGPPGLPPRFSRLHVDGLPAGSAVAPVRGAALDRFALHPDPLLEDPVSALVPMGRLTADALGASATAGTGLAASGAWTGMVRGGVLALAPGDGGRSDLEAVVAPEVAAFASGPLTSETTRLLVGVSGRRLLTPLPTLLAPLPLEEDGSPGSAPAGRNQVMERDVVSALFRLDSELSPTLDLSWQIRVATLPGETPSLGLPALPGLLLPSRGGSDLSTAARLLARSDGGTALELRLGVERSLRITGVGEGGTILPATGFVDRGDFRGAPLGASGEFERLTLTFAPTATFRMGEQSQVETGLTLAVRRHEERGAALPAEWILAPVAGQPPRYRELWAGPTPTASYTVPRAGIGARYRWTPAPGARLDLGLRADFEALPFDEITENEGWALLTGIPRAPLEEFRSGRLGPEAELRWRPGGTSPFLLQARGSMHHGDTEPWLLSELLREGGSTRITRALGSAEAGDPVRSHEAPRLTLRGPAFQRPRAMVGEVSIDAGLPAGWTVGAGAFWHRTDFLPRRRDLNRVPGVGVTDPFGRTHFGNPVLVGGLVAIEPGSDRRFPTFDRVDALESDGWTESSGVTLHAGWDSPRAHLRGSWTLSTATDNAPFDPAGFGASVDGAPDGALADPAWREGTSAFHTPHRGQVSAEATLPGLDAIRVGALLGVRSALPFTPGVRDGLGSGWTTGWTGLEPIAFDPGLLPAPFLEAWPCLRTATSTRRMERNACRGEAIRQLDLRVSVDLPFPGGMQGRLLVEGLNLLDEGDRILDAALFRAVPPAPEGAGPEAPRFERSSDGQSMILPVEPNPTFGTPLADLSPGRALRVGLEVRF